jgi:hypothetical protein
MSSLLILTVGTGTAGVRSNLAAGLKRSVELLAPRRFWLVPSTSEDSQTIAALIAEDPAIARLFAPSGAATRFHSIEKPDDLEDCRRSLRAAIAAARGQLRPGERLIVNPTSGTKQMSAAATLAALDEGIGDIAFTVGERADGVVITGTERIAAFDASAYFREHDLATARDLFTAGAFLAAEHILARHKEHCLHARATALLCHRWQRLDYEAAARAAATLNNDLRARLTACARHAVGGTPSPLILGDLLAWAGHAFGHKDPDAATRLAYKALEYAARCALHDPCGITPQPNGFYSLDDINALPLPPELSQKLLAVASPDIPLGLNSMMKILETLEHPLGHGWRTDNYLRKRAGIRNETVHDIRPVALNEAHSLLDRVRNLLKNARQDFTLPELPAELPAD